MAPIVLKEGVQPFGLRPEMALVPMVAAGIWEDLGAGYLMITSINDGQHSYGSKHWTGDAMDLRTHNLPTGTEQQAADRLRESLGNQGLYDVVLEHLGQPNEHIHVEWHPKG